jgi:hypothetical protein
MQTFLPYADFVDSAESLDAPRLGKQRVETLQLLRALVIPTYGWQSHPVSQMWRGYVPGLTRYGLDMADAWTRLGHADTVRPQMLEFAPWVDGVPIENVPLPSWFGLEELHVSHQSNLIRKDPEYYRPKFPGVSDDLAYVWPGPDPGVELPDPEQDATWIVRARDEAEFDEWQRENIVRLGEVSPRGRRPKAWVEQLTQFGEAIDVGDTVAVLHPDGTRLAIAYVVGSPRPHENERGEPGIARHVTPDSELDRGRTRRPEMLQNPRTLFQAPL